MFEIIENVGPNTLLNALKPLWKSASVIDLQVAFVTRSGAETLLPSIGRAAQHGKIRLLTGLYQGVTEPAALRLLLQKQRSTQGRFEIHLSRNPCFHRKLYAFRGRKVSNIICGSSNLSNEGLTSAGELTLLTREPNTSTALRRLNRLLDMDWKDSIPLSPAIIKRYESKRGATHRAPTISSSDIRALLGSKSTRAASTVRPPRFWRTWVDSKLDDQTSAYVERETGWSGDWQSEPGCPFLRGDHLLVLDLSGKRNHAKLVKVLATTRLAQRTPDGRDFVSYRSVRLSRERGLNSSFLDELKSVGLLLSKRKFQQRRKIRVTVGNLLIPLFRRKT